MSTVFTVPNILSLTRGLLALAFLIKLPLVRPVAIVLAALTDFFDGFLARRLGQISRFGIVIDPLMDKLFVSISLGIFFFEERVNYWQLASFFCRDISLLVFTIWLLASGTFSDWRVRSFFCGKVATALQFIALIVLALNSAVPVWLYLTMAGFGLFSLLELFWLQHRKLIRIFD